MSRIATHQTAQQGAGSPWQKARGYVHAWYWASRPFTLTGAVAPVLAGSALALRHGQASIGLFILVLVASLLVQVTANLVDEYSDHSRPGGKEKLPAPYKVIARGLLSSAAVKKGAMVTFGVAAAIGLYLVSIAGWPILAVCLASAAVAYLYAGGPRPLGTLGLGQPLVFFFMGPVMVAGTYYVYAGSVTFDALWLSFPVACTVTCILAANDLRDMEEDQAAGKTTPVTLWGRRFGRWECTLLVVAAYLMVITLAVVSRSILVLAPVLALPQAIRALAAVWQGRERSALVQGLRGVAQLHGWFGMLLAVGVGLGRFVSWP